MSVSASPDLQPLDDLLEGDIGENIPDLEIIAEHTRNPGPDPWGFGGDSCHVSIGPGEVHVENDATGQAVTMPRAEFLRILDEYAGAVAAARAGRP